MRRLSGERCAPGLVGRSAVRARVRPKRARVRAHSGVSASALQPTPCVTRGRLPCEVQFAERDSSWRLFNFKVNDSVLL
jgi:hypothetical protein